MEYSIKVSKEMTNDSYISNLKKVTIFSVHFWALLSFRQTLRERSVIYPKNIVWHLTFCSLPIIENLSL
jgi:hypothetical protein